MSEMGMPHESELKFAEIAIIGNRMLLTLVPMIYDRRYDAMETPRSKRNQANHMGAMLEAMFVSMLCAVCTWEGLAPTETEIHKQLKIPRTNVDRHTKVLEKNGVLKKIKYRYVADLQALDRVMRSRAHLEKSLAAIETCAAELRRKLNELGNVMDP